MVQPQRNEKREAFYRRLILCWEEKQQRDPFLVWDGSFRWFKSENVVPLERYRNSEEVERIRANILSPTMMYLTRATGPLAFR